MPGDTQDATTTGAQSAVVVQHVHEEKSLPVANVSGLESDGQAHELDDFPSEEDLVTLRRIAAHIPIKVFLIAFVEACERFSYYGTTIVVSHPMPTSCYTDRS